MTASLPEVWVGSGYRRGLHTDDVLYCVVPAYPFIIPPNMCT
eukprot:CAMPEP_0185542940 /NCGR_PEP_ID=MMETSP1381-20130426/2952_1 /TAXON_ID=298111 /ORGANISM="Pavlova sp., Strain CCMP459" /LENGTH=41 /DNA_ID= /DNA_START= /DNA_END= /DNA_ORIENTATION=